MIEDSEMAFKLEAMKREQEARRQKLQENVNLKMSKLKESANVAAEKIRILNQELQILRLEFQIEEAQLDAPRNDQKKYCWGSCFCTTNSYIQEEELNVSSVGLKEWFHVKHMEDYEIKLEKIRKRSQKLHSYGWNGCNKMSKQLEPCPNTFAFIGILFCPILCLNYFCYHCYAGVKNCCYRYGSRTHKIYQVYSGFQKCGNYVSISNKNTKKIEELSKVLAKQKQIRKMMLNQNSNLIEILNNELECLKLEYENEDLNDKQQYETLERERKTALFDCITLELDQFEKRQTTSQALSSYLKVDDHIDFFQKLNRLKSTDS